VIYVDKDGRIFVIDDIFIAAITIWSLCLTVHKEMVGSQQIGD